jgi:hypothetical protein
MLQFVNPGVRFGNFIKLTKLSRLLLKSSMSRILRLIIALLILLAIIYGGYEFGRRMGRNDMQSQLIENYSFVREIAELASLEVNGISTFKATNIANDGSFSDALKKMFAEKTVHLSMPYTAKYGVDLRDSAMRITRKDSVVEIHLPPPRLLSYELRLDRMDATSSEGLLFASKADLYTVYQKQLYSEGRAQLARNQNYLSQTAEGVSRIIRQYFNAAGLHAVCIFDEPSRVGIPKD